MPACAGVRVAVAPKYVWGAGLSVGVGAGGVVVVEVGVSGGAARRALVGRLVGGPQGKGGAGVSVAHGIPSFAARVLLGLMLPLTCTKP